MAMYEPEATYISASGRPLRGRQIEQMFQRLTALRSQMSGNIERSGGISAVVLRRRADSSWGILIDNPGGAGRHA